MASKHPTFILNKPEYLSNSLQQLFHNRERAIKLYIETLKQVAIVETEIASAACPWKLGQIVNYYNCKADNPITLKAVIARIEFTFEEPFYRVHIRTLSKHGVYGKITRIKNLAQIIGAVDAKPVSTEELLRLIEKGVVRTEKYIDTNDPNFSGRLLKSYELGETLMKVSPQVEVWLRESLRLGKKPEPI